MWRRVLLVLCLAVVSCGRSSEVAATSPREKVTPETIPIDHSTLSYDRFRLKVYRTGTLDWNGQLIDRPNLETYLQQFAAFPADADRLSVQFEPGVGKDLETWVRHDIIASGLCRQHRCVQSKWGVKTPIVN